VKHVGGRKRYYGPAATFSGEIENPRGPARVVNGGQRCSTYIPAFLRAAATSRWKNGLDVTDLEIVFDESNHRQLCKLARERENRGKGTVPCKIQLGLAKFDGAPHVRPLEEEGGTLR
jgi:hypothetical protein